MRPSARLMADDSGEQVSSEASSSFPREQAHVLSVEDKAAKLKNATTRKGMRRRFICSINTRDGALCFELATVHKGKKTKNMN